MQCTISEHIYFNSALFTSFTFSLIQNRRATVYHVLQLLEFTHLHTAKASLLYTHKNNTMEVRSFQSHTTASEIFPASPVEHNINKMMQNKLSLSLIVQYTCVSCYIEIPDEHRAYVTRELPLSYSYI